MCLIVIMYECVFHSIYLHYSVGVQIDYIFRTTYYLYFVICCYNETCGLRVFRTIE